MDAKGIKTELKSLRKDLNSFVEEYAKLGAGLGIAAFAALSKGAMELAGNLSDASANIGVNVESLQALQAQHKRNGVSEEELSKALQKTKAAVLDAAAGNVVAEKAFAALGLTSASLLALPLDKQYAAIATATAEAKDQSAAFSAVSDILGAKVGPKLMGSLRELGETGLPGVTDAAKKAGQVMSAETIVALDEAGDAIDDFKRKATVWAGEIIVNFRTEDGLKLLGLQLMAVLGRFGGGILDAITEAGGMIWAVFKGAFFGVTNYLQDGLVEVVQGIAGMINKILPAKFEINVGNLEEFKSSGKGIADEITEAIARTSPSTFKKDFGDSWDAAITKQKSVVDALNKVDFKEGTDKLTNAGNAAGKSVSESITKTVKSDVPEPIVKAFKDGAKAAAEIIDTGWQMTVGKRGEAYRNASDDALKQIIQDSKQKASELRYSQTGSANERAYNQAAANQYDAEAKKAQDQLNLRGQIRSDYGQGGALQVYRNNRDLDPQYLDGLITQFAKNLAPAEDAANALRNIQRGLAQRGIIPNG